MAEESDERIAGMPEDPRSALDAVLPRVYEELRDLARKALGPESRALTLQPTALVHEAYLRLQKDRAGWVDQSHFMVAAATAMRRVLVDHIRTRRSAKRGGGRRASADAEQLAIEDRSFDVLAIEEAMRGLEAEDEDSARVAELRVFGGLSGVDCAEALGVSSKTVQRRWRFARAWLIASLEGEEPAG